MTTLKRSIFQPNPGWGHLCEYCIHRDRIDLARNSFPCKAVVWHPPGNRATTAYFPNLTRMGNADGRAEFGIHFQEECSDYEYDGVS